MNESGAAAHIADAGAQAISALRSAGIAAESLAELVPARRGFLRRIPPKMRPLGSCWRLGVLLLADPSDDHDDAFIRARQKRRRSEQAPEALPLWLIAGTSTRSAERGRPNFQSESREERRELAAAALRGGYPVGTVVHFDSVPLPLDEPELRSLTADSPVGLCDGMPRVRWRAGVSLAGGQAFDRYVAERVELLIHPPARAT